MIVLNQPRWILWRKDPKKGKIPVSAKTGRDCDATKMSNGVTYDEAVDGLIEHEASGLGILLGDGLVGVDIDEACTEDGALLPDAEAIVGMLMPAYVEYSPSGRGIHVLGIGKKGTDRCTAKLPNSKKLEVYDKARFFTFTGEKIPGSTDAPADFQQGLTKLCDTFLPEAQLQPVQQSPTREDEWSDEEVLNAARSAANAMKFIDLWEGNTDAYDGDHSAADAALINFLLFYNGGNIEQADRLFRESALMRSKWDEVHSANGDTYGEYTLKRQKAGMSRFRSRRRPLTEVGVAERIRDRHAHEIQYCYEWNEWQVWDGKRWAKDRTGKVLAKAIETLRSIPDEATNDDERKAIIKFARNLERNTSINNIVRQTEHLVPVLPLELDQDLFALNCQNGTLDLDTGVLRPHNPADKLTKIIKVAYDPVATCPIFDEFLNVVMENNQNLIDYIWQSFGMSLTGSITAQCFFFLFGSGDNGKSVLLGILRELLGEYAKVAAPGVFMEKKYGDGIPNDLADLHGARVVTDIETKHQVHLNEQRIKAVTGGEPVKARFLNKEFFTFKPQMKLWLASNHKPTISGTDKGIWRRIKAIPFDAVIPEDKKDPDLEQKIISRELPGVLAKAVQACVKWRKTGVLVTPPEVAEFSNEYRKEMDVVGLFLEDCCEVGGDTKSKARDLYNAYKSWALRSGYQHPYTETMFGIKIKERGFVQGREKDTKRSRYYEGIKIIDDSGFD